MTIIVYGAIRNGDIVAGDVVYRNVYDPNDYLKEHDDEDDLIITIKLFVSKGGKLTALVDKISIA